MLLHWTQYWLQKRTWLHFSFHFSHSFDSNLLFYIDFHQAAYSIPISLDNFVKFGEVKELLKSNISTTTLFWEMNSKSFEKSVIELSFWSVEPLSRRVPLSELARPPFRVLFFLSYTTTSRPLFYTAACSSYRDLLLDFYTHGVQGCRPICRKHFGEKCLLPFSDYLRKPKNFPKEGTHF